ncbi:MAG: cation:proton antiporter [Lentisphaerae bacterium]|nr:cation:proton antiporter [Lentisphaerota bacterium]
MMRRLALFLLCFAVWIVLVWPPRDETGALRLADLSAGALAALLAAAVMREFTFEKTRGLLDPRRYLWLAAYGVVLLFYIVKANFDVAYRVLHPAMPIRPGIVKVRTSLRSASAITALANSITLTPGTLTVEATADGWLYVHWIHVTTTDPEEAARHIVSRFEWFISRIFA